MQKQNTDGQDIMLKSVLQLRLVSLTEKKSSIHFPGGQHPCQGMVKGSGETNEERGPLDDDLNLNVAFPLTWMIIQGLKFFLGVFCSVLSSPVETGRSVLVFFSPSDHGCFLAVEARVRLARTWPLLPRPETPRFRRGPFSSKGLVFLFAFSGHGLWEAAYVKMIKLV